MHKRKSTSDALTNYFKKQIKPDAKRKRKTNGKPEKAVEKACLAWMRSKGWSVQIYEAKATYNPQAGRWVSSAMKAGTADCQGNTPSGTTVVVEFKAPGRLTTFNNDKNHRQKEYIVEKIRSNCFAAVVDSARRLEEIFDGYEQALLVSKDQAQMFLLAELP